MITSIEPRVSQIYTHHCSVHLHSSYICMCFPWSVCSSSFSIQPFMPSDSQSVFFNPASIPPWCQCLLSKLSSGGGSGKTQIDLLHWSSYILGCLLQGISTLLGESGKTQQFTLSWTFCYIVTLHHSGLCYLKLPLVLAMVLDYHFVSGSGSKPNLCQMRGSGRQ